MASPTATQPAATPRRPVFLLVGDSVTQDANSVAQQGWGALLAERYLHSVDVLNRGFSGYNTKLFLEYALPVIREEFTSSLLAPAVITLWLGANDAARIDGPEQSQHIPVDQYRQNLILILQEFQKLAPSAMILLITPPVVDDSQRHRIQMDEDGLGAGPLDRDNEQAAKYAHACTTVAAELDGITLLNLHEYFMETYPDPADRASFFSDGLHFTAKGNCVVYEQIKSQIEKCLPAETFQKWQISDYKELI